jgi:hypothetical protein
VLTPEKIAACGSEHAHQTALFAQISHPEIRAKYPELSLAFAIPNGGARDKRTAAGLKAEGVKAGVWDVFLPVPVRRAATETDPALYFHGLWIEFKVRPNKLTPEQHDFYCALGPYGYDWYVAYTWREAYDKIISYLGVR